MVTADELRDLIERDDNSSDLPAEQDAKRAGELRRLGVHGFDSLTKLVTQEAKHPYQVEGLIKAKSINLLVGDSNLGKTPLGMQLGLCIAAGLPFLNRTTQRGPILYCDAESDIYGFHEMLRAISGFLKVSCPPDFLVWSPNWDQNRDASEIYGSWSQRLMTRVQVVKPQLVIVDPLRMFWPKSETGNDETSEMIKSMREITRSTGTSWLLTHHRRKVNQGVPSAKLDQDPHGWFQEAAGAHAIVNQTDTRIGVIQHPGEADLLVGGFVRGTGPFVPLDLTRVPDDDGVPLGYRLLTGIEFLSGEDRAAFEQLSKRFRFKDVKSILGGKSDSNALRLLKKCQSLDLVKKDGRDYVKVLPSVVESVERVE